MIEDQEFSALDYTKSDLERGTYQYCRFVNCQLSGVTLSHCVFVECEFFECDLSNAKVANTAFRDVKFKNCKMLGIRFEHCNPFLLTMAFEGCQLNLSSFYQLPLKGSKWVECGLREVDFTGADLTGATLDVCDLLDAAFDNTRLEKTDFRTAFNYSIDPENNYIKKARFSLPAVVGLLHKYNIEID